MRSPIPRARTGPAAELVLAADQFVVAPAGRVADTALIRATGDEARTIIAGLPLVHGLGARHHDRPRGPDAGDRAPRRGGLHPPHLRPLRPRRPDPQHVSRGHARGPVPHRRRHPLVLPRASTATSGRRGIARHSRLLLPTLRRDRRAPRARAPGSASASIPRTGSCGRARRGYQLTWMDAKVEDWVVTPRRGKAVEINALWHNALRLLETLGARGARRRGGRAPDGAGRAGPGGVQRALLVRRGRLPLRRGRRGERRRHGLPTQSAPRDLARASGARPGAVDVRPRGGPRAPASRRWGSGPSRRATRTTRRPTTETSGPATPPTIRARSGPG